MGLGHFFLLHLMRFDNSKHYQTSADIYEWNHTGGLWKIFKI